MLSQEWKISPPLTAEDLEEQNKRFPVYLWYRKLGKVREFTCTACRQTYEVMGPYQRRTYTQEEAILWDARHKQKSECMKCGAVGEVRNIPLSKSCQDQRSRKTLARVRVESYDEVYIDCYWVVKSYHYGTYLSGLPRWEHDSCYRLTPKSATQAYANWSMFSARFSWYDRGKECIDAFLANGWTVGQKHEDYIVEREELLQNTFLARVGFEKINIRKDTGIIPYLYNVVRYPALEQLLKAGYRDIVKAWLDGCHFSGRMNMRGRSPREIFGLKPAECRALAGVGERSELMRHWYREWKKDGYSFDTVTKLVHFCGLSSTCFFLNVYDYDPEKLLSYLSRQYQKKLSEFENREIGCHHAAFALAPTQRSIAQHLKDYRFMCQSEAIRAEEFPKDVYEAHDQVFQTQQERLQREAADAVVRDLRYYTENYRRETETKQKRAEAAMAKHADKAQKLLRRRIKDYSYHDEIYTVVIPQSALDLVEEGRALHHCVGTYSEKFCKGLSDILFIRRIDAIDKPLLTMEVVKKKEDFCVMQCYGFKDDRPVSRASDAWLMDDYNAWLSIYHPSVRQFAKDFENYLMSKGEQNGKFDRVG